MKQLFDELSFSVSKATTEKYSTSFSLGIKALNIKLRPAIYAIYGYVRLADEIVDSFQGYPQAHLLDRFIEQTQQALDERISLNPILQSFQETVFKYKIDHELITVFLKSMAMDLSKLEYNNELYKEYIVGSAEVVGLMCLHVFVDGDLEKYEQLKPFAMKLGSAFQKINFLRDLKDDYHILGRTYFPNVDMDTFDNQTKIHIEEDIASEFKEALIGIKKLPLTSRFGVYLAYKYYWKLFKKIQKTPAQNILNNRIRIPDSQKLMLMMGSYMNYKLARL